MLEFECRYWGQGIRRLAGVDEAGRGPLAGPVFAAAVVFTREEAESRSGDDFKGLTDSKKLSASRRQAFHDRLIASPAIEVGIGHADVAEIDSLNILRATHLAMARALDALPKLPEHAIVDGLAVKGLPCPSTSIVKGDSQSLSIAAASVIAKVARDRVLMNLDEAYPEYGFSRHKGYGTRAHMEALRQHGPCPAHRKSFRPVRECGDLFYQEGLRDEPSAARRAPPGRGNEAQRSGKPES